MTKIKICGLTRSCDIEAVNKYRPDYVGFVFAKSKRQITEDGAAVLKSQLDSGILAVGVFVNEHIDHIAKMANAGIIDVVQLHGDESENYVKLLKSKTKARIIRAVRVGEAVDLEIADATMADFPLLDTYHKDAYGGTGMCFDWSYLKAASRPYFLAGGIGCDNITEAKKTGAYCLDVSSGAETDGYKDADKIAFLCQKAHEK